MKDKSRKCPPCPKCQGKMTAYDDKYWCDACHHFYYQLSWINRSQEGWK